MCGIVAYHGPSPALPSLLGGLSRLEYRGYDSAGLALSTAGGEQLTIHRAAGRLAALLKVLPDDGTDCSIGIGHTRWATHGAPTESNAHPHLDCAGAVAVVHNGTIDNAVPLRAQLAATGHTVVTDVDTEIVAHLIEDRLIGCAGRDLAQLAAAVAAAVHQLQGSWALAVTVVGVPGVVLARHRSPLLVAETSDALLASSDTLGFSGELVAVREVRDGEIVTLGPDRELSWYDRHGRRIGLPTPLDVHVEHIGTDLQGAPDYTSKEINDQPAAAKRLIDRLIGSVPDGTLPAALGLPVPAAVRLVACGSSAYAAQVTARVLATACGVPARVVTASEHTTDLDEAGTLTVAFSQSGETANVPPGTPGVAVARYHQQSPFQPGAMLRCGAGSGLRTRTRCRRHQVLHRPGHRRLNLRPQRGRRSGHGRPRPVAAMGRHSHRPTRQDGGQRGTRPACGRPTRHRAGRSSRVDLRVAWRRCALRLRRRAETEGTRLPLG